MSNGKRQIVILQRGWIVVGDVTREGNDVVVSNSSVIRRWGTKNGIGQLALAGPTSETILDPLGRIESHELAVVGRIDVTMVNGKPVI
jgi:hypothetical protein